MRVRTPRIALFFWEGHFSAAPSIVGAIRMMATHGIGVDAIYRSPDPRLADRPVLPPETCLWECNPLSRRMGSRYAAGVLARHPDQRGHGNRILSWPGRFLASVSKNILAVLDVAQFVGFSLRRVIGRDYTLLLGVDTYGIICASAVALLKRTPTAYFCLELYFLGEMKSRLKRAVKRAERWCSQKAKFIIIQDEYRARSLATENQLNGSDFVLVPNAPMGPAMAQRSRYFHELFGLEERERVILYTGVIDPMALSLEIARAASRWPRHFRLVLHERVKRMTDDPYLRAIRRAGGERVLLSLEPVPLDDLDRLVSSGDIGLVLYSKDAGQNIAQIAGASGKLAYYLRAGLPVICSDLPGLREVIEEYRCGIPVSSLDEVESAIARITENYAAFSANAVRCYEERYEFGQFFAQVIERIQRAAVVV